MPLYGFHNKLLRIDLVERRVTEELIPDAMLRFGLGGKGLAVQLLMKYLPEGAKPLSADNVLIFVTGPAADTTVPAASRFGVFAKSPLTGLLGESYSGGHVAPIMKRTGYDAIMLEGVSEEPVYL
ncbi:MAG: aldehyde ferredoxin oxidoreductase N-terminal domain-containing protein, partial [Bacillota bacterium]